jgi:hypothetical protein
MTERKEIVNIAKHMYGFEKKITAYTFHQKHAFHEFKWIVIF